MWRSVAVASDVDNFHLSTRTCCNTININETIVAVRLRPGPVLPTGASVWVLAAVSSPCCTLLIQFEYTSFSCRLNSWPLCTNMTSSRKPGVLSIWQRRHAEENRATATANMHDTYTHTHTHTHTNTLITTPCSLNLLRYQQHYYLSRLSTCLRLLLRWSDWIMKRRVHGVHRRQSFFHAYRVLLVAVHFCLPKCLSLL